MRRYRRRSRPQYLLPFLALVSIGVLFILAFQLWSGFAPTAKGDALYYLAEGRSKVLSFGTTEWENVYNGSKVKLGDSVKTLNNAKGAMTFYDGTVLRMDENTQITLLDINKKNDYQEILIYVNGGKIWVNKPKQNAIRKTDFVINTNWASYAITGTIFDLEKDIKETLNVLHGQVQVDVIENKDGKIHTIESMPVGIGQSSTLDEASMKAFYERQSPSVLATVDSLFQTTAWYIWNNNEDENPTDFANGQPNNSIINENEASASVTMVLPNELSAGLSDLPAPILISPKASLLKTSTDIQTISGKVGEGVKKILVTQKLAGSDKSEKILINNFDSTKLTWNYNLSLLKGNIKSGINTYEFVGIDEGAKQTAALKVEVDFAKDGGNSELDSVNNLISLEKPKVSTIDGKTYKDSMTISKSAFAISGTVAAGASALWVDDFKLSKFKSGDTTWTYNINESYGNWKPGLNTYQVYGVDDGGKKSPILTLKMDYDKPVAVIAKPVVTVTATPPAVVIVPETTAVFPKNTTP